MENETQGGAPQPMSQPQPMDGAIQFNQGTVQPVQPEVSYQPPVADQPIMQTQSTAEIKYAGFWIRWVAGFIDGIVLQVVGFIGGFMIGFVLAIAGMTKITPFISGFFGLILGWGYNIFMIHKYQATLGKMAIGVAVISEEGNQLSLGKIILRETLGKILSVITLFIGYIMAGFTAKKQALHDKIAGSVVVYRDPNKKVAVWVIVVVIIGAVLIMVATIGILASIVLVSLNSARNKVQDAAIKATLSSTNADAIIYEDTNTSYKGYKPQASASGVVCSGQPVINISPDGKQMAIFLKSCTDKTKYFCGNPATSLVTATAEVSDAYVKSGATICNSTDIPKITAPAENTQATTTSANTQNADNYKTFQSKDGKYSMQYPSSWVFEEDKASGLNSFTSGDDNHNIIVGFISDKDANFDKVVSRFKEVCAYQKGVGKIYDEKDFTYNLDGKNIVGKQLKSDCNINNNMTKQWVVVLPYKSDNYTWIYTSSLDKFNSDMAGKIVNTLKLLN
jgi:uncharacterized RDD family membrane protein YckC